jgi:hypothetical protein
MMTVTTDTHAHAAYEHADRAVNHYVRLLEGDGLTRDDRRFFGEKLLRALWARAVARRRMERDSGVTDGAAPSRI